ncbi:MAG: hypothetical protein IT258_19170 [Saprospiraceae bacterium]|nr:hypothetical protein [Saprospiraceae bacterium]
MTYLFVLYFLLAKRFSTSETETKRYTVLYKDKTVGELTASRTIDDGVTTYRNTTTITAKVVTEMQVKFNIQSSYKGKHFEWSKVDITRNGKPYATASTKRVGNGYHFYKDGQLYATITGNIVYSAARMMFEEPKGILNAFSEENGVFDAIEKTGKSTYKKLNSRGKNSIYRYQNGALCSMTMDLGLAEMEMVLKE